MEESSRPNTNTPGRRRRSTTPSVGTLATTAIVAYGTYKLVNWAWGAWHEDRDDDETSSMMGGRLRGMLERPLSYGARWRSQKQHEQQHWRLRRQRVERCRAETAKALTDFLPTMRRTIEELTDTAPETSDLKQLRAEKRSGDKDSINKQHRGEQERALWDSIKIKTVTRMMSTAYAHTILFLVLTVQVHVIGGRLFEEQEKESGPSDGGVEHSTPSLGNRSHESSASDRMGSYQASHRMVLTGTYDFFFDQGIAALVQTVDRTVSDVMHDWDVMDPSFMSVSREMIDDAIRQIRDSVEGRNLRFRERNGRSQSRRRRHRNIVRFLLPPEQGLDHIMTDDDLAQSILNETWDLLESPVLEDAQRDCLNVTFDAMKSRHWENIFLDSGESVLSTQGPSQWTTRPLANVITQLRNATNSFYDVRKLDAPARTSPLFPSPQGTNMYCSALEQIPSTLELGDVSFN